MNSIMYNRKFLRETINNLTGSEFDRSLDGFLDVRKLFTRGMDNNDKVNIVLDYFEKHQEYFNQFLEAIKECNPKAYEKSFNKRNNAIDIDELKQKFLA